MYIYICVCICDVCIYTRIYISQYIYIYVYTCTHIQICIYTYLYRPWVEHLCAWCDCLYIGMQHSTHECRQQVMVHVTFSCQLPLYVIDYDQSCRWIMSEKHREYRVQRDRERQRERLCVCTCSTHTNCWVSVLMLCSFPSFFSLSLSLSFPPSLS